MSPSSSVNPYSLAKSQTKMILPVFSNLLGSIANLTIDFLANSTDSVFAKASNPDDVDLCMPVSKKNHAAYLDSKKHWEEMDH